ncbi:MAG: MerR family transcriptional regulator [Actinomycetota bacterium]|nr:MerR family transcriptional regulator [Actinomycetota bacterium]
MDSATVHRAAQTTGWSVRMLHYLDAAGLVSPPRSAAGYRLYGDREIARLRTLRQLLADHDLRPADLQVALRLRSEPNLRHAVDDWIGSVPLGAPTVQEDPAAAPPPAAPTLDQDPSYPTDAATSWLRFEQDKHSRAIAFTSHSTKETA